MGQVGLFTDINENHSAAIPDGPEIAALVRGVPAQVDRISFAKAIANGVDPTWGSVITTGAGQTINQTGGNLVITTGTTINSETIIRGSKSYGGSGLRQRAQVTLSQRVANQSFFVELVDVIASAAAITITSATAVTVTIPSNPFTAQNVGQFMYLGGYAGTGTFVPGRYAIASVAGNNVTYTVAGFAAGTGTVHVFGWNYYHMLYDSTTATSAKFDTQRMGWALGDVVISIATTAAPGHIFAMTSNDLQAGIVDAATNGTLTTTRGQRTANVPDDAKVQVQIRAVNGTVAPTTTTMTVGFVSVAEFSALDTVIQDIRPTPSYSQLPAVVTGTVTVQAASVTAPVYVHPANFGTNYFVVTTASTNAAVVKAAAGNLSELTICNTTATAAYVKLFNKASAPTVGTDVPIATFRVAPTGTSGDFVVLDFGVGGKRFTTGIAICVTAAVAPLDTAVAVAGIQIHGTYV